MPAVAVVAAVASAAVGVASVVQQQMAIREQKSAVKKQGQQARTQIAQQEKEFQATQEQLDKEAQAQAELNALEKQRASGGATVKLGAASTADAPVTAPATKTTGTRKGAVTNSVGGLSASKKLGV